MIHDGQISILSESLTLLESWKTSLHKTRSSLVGEERGWDFDRVGLFLTVDCISRVCKDVLQIIRFIGEFSPSLAEDLSTFAEFDGVGEIANKMNEITEPIMSISFDPFDERSVDKWDVAMETFQFNLKDAESFSSSCIDKAFQKLSSAEKAFAFVENYTRCNYRPSLDKRINEIYNSILEKYFDELDDLEREFSRCKEHPPRSNTSLPTSGSIEWANILYQRAKQPMMQFSKCKKLISSVVGKEARERYLEFARTIDLYKSDLVNTWTLRANEILNELSTPILANRVNKQTLSEK